MLASMTILVAINKRFCMSVPVRIKNESKKLFSFIKKQGQPIKITGRQAAVELLCQIQTPQSITEQRVGRLISMCALADGAISCGTYQQTIEFVSRLHGFENSHEAAKHAANKQTH
jgi:RNA 3'-terminal phosphate cyclase